MIPPHGMPQRYRGHGCRCDECREAHRLEQIEVRKERRANPIPDHVIHGLYSTYRNWGCSCEPCRIANTERHREWRQSKRAS